MGSDQRLVLSYGKWQNLMNNDQYNMDILRIDKCNVDVLGEAQFCAMRVVLDQIRVIYRSSRTPKRIFV